MLIERVCKCTGLVKWTMMKLVIKVKNLLTFTIAEHLYGSERQREMSEVTDIFMKSRNFKH